MLGPFHCGRLTPAPLLPKLRGYFAEFLNNASPVGLGILSPSTCVGLRYGRYVGNSGFSWRRLLRLRYLLFRSARALSPCLEGFSLSGLLRVHRVFLPPAPLSPPRPHSSATYRCRNLHLLPIGCGFPPRLRSRLSRGRQASPRKPWIFGRKDSHLPLATHSGILPSVFSTMPYSTASAYTECSPTDVITNIPRLRYRVLAPVIFGAGPLGQ